MSKDKKRGKTMADISAGYEKFIKDKEINQEGKAAFEKAIKKATKTKQRGSK